MTETAKQEKVNQESKQEQRYYYTVMEEQEGMRLDQFLSYLNLPFFNQLLNIRTGMFF